MSEAYSCNKLNGWYTQPQLYHVAHIYEDELDDADLDEIFLGSDDELDFMEEVETDDEKYIMLLQTVLYFNCRYIFPSI